MAPASSSVPLRKLVPIQPRPLHDASHASVLTAHALAASEARAAQRHKHRLAVKRAYHAKLNGLSALRDEERALEARYQQLTKQSVGTEDTEETSSARALYVQLLDVRRALERENAALRGLAAQHEQFQTRLRLAARAEGVVVGAAGDEATDRSDDQENRRRVAVSQETLSPVVKQAPALPVVKITPLTPADCFKVIRETWPQVLAFMGNRNSLHSGSQVFGWTHKYFLPPVAEATELEAAGGSAKVSPRDHKLQYSISKVFHGVGAYELSQRGWEIMTTQRHYRALHSSTMTSEMHLVQRVDNDNMVFLRILKRGGQSTMFKTLLLASQFQVDKGVLTIYRGLDPSRVISDEAQKENATTQQPASSNAVWLEMFSWTYFEDQDDGKSVKFEFGGEMRHTSNDNAKFWMMEVLLMALRWENMAVGPLFKLTNPSP